MPKYRAVFFVSAILIALGLLFFQSGDEKEGEPTSGMPPFLLGEWQSLDGDYKDRSLEFAADSFTIGRGEFGPVTHNIAEIRRTTSETGDPFYVLHYSDDDSADQRFSVRYLQAYDEIRIKNIDHVSWRRPNVIEKTLAKQRERDEKREHRRAERKQKRKGT